MRAKKILWTFTKKNMGLFLAQLCMFITSRKILNDFIPFKQIFFNTSLIVSQKHKCISIVVLLVFNFQNASRLYGHPIYIVNQNSLGFEILYKDSHDILQKHCTRPFRFWVSEYSKNYWFFFVIGSPTFINFILSTVTR